MNPRNGGKASILRGSGEALGGLRRFPGAPARSTRLERAFEPSLWPFHSPCGRTPPVVMTHPLHSVLRWGRSWSETFGKAKGRQPHQRSKATGLRKTPVDAPPTLAEAGIDKAKVVGKAKGAAEKGTNRGTTRVAEKPASLAKAGIDTPPIKVLLTRSAARPLGQSAGSNPTSNVGTLIGSTVRQVSPVTLSVLHGCVAGSTICDFVPAVMAFRASSCTRRAWP